MGFRGELGPLNLFDLVQMIAATAKSGRLDLSRRDGRGMVVFRGGRIILALSDSLQQTMGSLLLGDGLIDRAQLERALELQQERGREVRLGSVLIEEGLISEADLQHAIERQVEKVISDLGAWRSGYFEFVPMELPDRGELAVDTRDLFLPKGLSADRVLLSIAVKLDEEERGDGAAGSGQAAAGEAELPPLAPPPDPAAASGAAAGESTNGSTAVAAVPRATGDAAGRPETGDSAVREQLASLRELMAEIQSPKLTGEITARILDQASRVFRRAVLFAVHPRLFAVVGHFGLDGATDPGAVKVRIDQPSVLRRAAQLKKTYRGPLGNGAGDRALVEQLGGGRPAEVVALPMEVASRAALVVYGDNYPAEEPPGPLDDLELLLLQTALAMERSLYQERVAHLEVLESLRTRG